VFPSLGAHLAHLLVQKEKEKKVLQFGAVLPQFIESCGNAGSTSSDNFHRFVGEVDTFSLVGDIFQSFPKN
jgi:hypothetical protein